MTKMNVLTITALVLIFLGGVGAILLTIGQSISSSQDKKDIINTTKEENINLKVYKFFVLTLVLPDIKLS